MIQIVDYENLEKNSNNIQSWIKISENVAKSYRNTDRLSFIAFNLIKKI